MVRAKFRLSSVTTYSDTSSKKLIFTAISDSSIPENAAFTKYTPNGQLEMHVDNPSALEKFEVGKYYYLDFTPAECV